MKSKLLMVVSAGLVLASVLSVAKAMAPEGGGGPQPQWHCNDDGSTTINGNVGVATRYTVGLGSSSHDANVVVVVKDSTGALVSETTLSGAGSSIDADVPAGGSIGVSDPTDVNSMDAQGPYSSQPL